MSRILSQYRYPSIDIDSSCHPSEECHSKSDNSGPLLRQDNNKALSLITYSIDKTLLVKGEALYVPLSYLIQRLHSLKPKFLSVYSELYPLALRLTR